MRGTGPAGRDERSKGMTREAEKTSSNEDNVTVMLLRDRYLPSTHGFGLNIQSFI